MYYFITIVDPHHQKQIIEINFVFPTKIIFCVCLSIEIDKWIIIGFGRGGKQARQIQLRAWQLPCEKLKLYVAESEWPQRIKVMWGQLNVIVIC